jgi:carboxymethylenebutenolidase
MSIETIKVAATSGGAFDCYVSLPKTAGKVPAIVLACAVYGVDKDIRDIADEFASHGYIAAAPDLFWRTVPGPLPRDDRRSVERARPRLERIKAGEADMADTLKAVQALPQSNGRAAAIGFCYGGPYAILGPKRLGYDAGISCHGSQFMDYLEELEGVTAPLCLLWGDQDAIAPAPVRDAYRAASESMPNLEVHIFPGVDHGYTLPGGRAFDAKARAFSMTRTLAILNNLRENAGQPASLEALDLIQDQ